MKPFNHMLLSIEDGDIDKPITSYTDANSPQVQLIMNLYSMEPSFYADLNNASMTMDESKLTTLGPFAKALYGVLATCDLSDKKREDAIERGNQFQDQELGRMCRSFLLFRGALIDKEWLGGWYERVGKDLKLDGYTSTSKSLDVALGFSGAETEHSINQQPTLFVFSIRNYFGFSGFRLSDKRWSIYSQEEEYLLNGGFRVFVLDIEHDFEISSHHQDLKKYDGKTITIIYL